MRMRALVVRRPQIIRESEAFTECSFQFKILGIEALQGAHIGGTNIKVMGRNLAKLMTSGRNSSRLRSTAKATTIPLQFHRRQ